MSCRACASEPARRAAADGDSRAPIAFRAAARIGASGEIRPATVGAVASPSDPSACASESAARAQRRRSSLTRNRETDERGGRERVDRFGRPLDGRGHVRQVRADAVLAPQQPIEHGAVFFRGDLVLLPQVADERVVGGPTAVVLPLEMDGERRGVGLELQLLFRRREPGLGRRQAALLVGQFRHHTLVVRGGNAHLAAQRFEPMDLAARDDAALQAVAHGLFVQLEQALASLLVRLRADGVNEERLAQVSAAAGCRPTSSSR